MNSKEVKSMTADYYGLNHTNITTRKLKTKMAASTVVTLTEMNRSLIIEDILSQVEKDEVDKMIEEESKLSAPDNENAHGDENVLGEHENKNRVGSATRPKPDIGKILEEATLDDLNEVFGRIGDRFNRMEDALDEYQVSLEYSQKEVDQLKAENKLLKKELETIKKEGKRSEYQVKELEDKFDRIDTTVRKKNLVLEGIPETDHGVKEDVHRTVYKVMDQMRIDYPIECDTCFRTGLYSRNRPRPVVVTFLKSSDRDHVFAKRTSLKNSKDYSNVWVNEDLAPAIRRTKTMVRLIARQAQEKGIACRNNKFSVTVNDVKYDERSLTELPPPLSTQNIKQIQIDTNTIAYQSEYAPLSSMYPAKVKIGEQEYDTSEQAFQHIRAKKHKKMLLAERILLCKKTYTIKQMGDEITPSQEWNDCEEDVMYSIQLRKFNQNPELADMLIATGTCQLVEATPSRKWGAGATLSSNILRRHEWKGENRHGKILMTVRAKLIRDRKAEEENKKGSLKAEKKKEEVTTRDTN